MQKKRVYISGPITNNKNYKQQFSEAEKKLRAVGYTPVNPVNGAPKGLEYKQYIDRALKILFDCDCIYMMQDYGRSFGALLELDYAKTVQMDIVFYDEL